MRWNRYNYNLKLYEISLALWNVIFLSVTSHFQIPKMEFGSMELNVFLINISLNRFVGGL